MIARNLIERIHPDHDVVPPAGRPRTRRRKAFPSPAATPSWSGCPSAECLGSRAPHPTGRTTTSPEDSFVVELPPGQPSLAPRGGTPTRSSACRAGPNGQPKATPLRRRRNDIVEAHDPGGPPSLTSRTARSPAASDTTPRPGCRHRRAPVRHTRARVVRAGPARDARPGEPGNPPPRPAPGHHGARSSG